MVDKNEKIVERYYLQNLASKYCYIEGKKEGLKYPSNWHKVSKCRVLRHSSDNAVSVLKSKDYDTSHYGGLIVCARAWVCPVCAPIMQAKRAERVAKAFQWAYSKELRSDAISLSEDEHEKRENIKNSFLEKKLRRFHMPKPDLLRSELMVVMVTFTTPHNSTDTVQTLFPRFSSAMASMKEQRRYKDFKKNIGYVGEITASEITFGLNGPHIHRHVLYFIKDIQNDEQTASHLKEMFQKLWGHALQRSGLLDEDGSKQHSDFLKHGIDVIARAHESDYISKQGTEDSWGADAEITKASSKTGKLFGRTPFEVLYGSAKSAKDAQVFIDYVKGTKGKAQLTFSPGFKKLIGFDELEDAKQDELDASQSNSPADLLAQLDDADWSLVVKSKNRGELLKIASLKGKEGILSFIENLKKPPIDSNYSYNNKDLFNKHFETLCSIYDTNPLTNIDPRKALKGGNFEEFLIDFYMHKLEELERIA